MRWLVIYLLFFVSFGYGQNCQKKYFEVLDTGKCTVVAMSAFNYASLYRDQSTLNIVRDSIPRLIKRMEQERRKAYKIDSLRSLQVETHNLLAKDYLSENIGLQVRNHELYTRNEKTKRSKKNWKDAAVIEAVSLLLIILL